MQLRNRILLSILLVLCVRFSESTALSLQPVSRQPCGSKTCDAIDEVCALADPESGRPDLCMPGRDVGEYCIDYDFSSQCKPHLKCIGGRCEGNRVVLKGETCYQRGVLCESSLTCHLLRCFERDAEEGSLCGPKHLRLCKTGLICVGPTDSQRCTKPIPEGGECDPSIGSCARGLQCLGPTGFERCAKRVAEGGQCAFPYWICSEGLTCVHQRCERASISSHTDTDTNTGTVTKKGFRESCVRSEECAAPYVCGLDTDGKKGKCSNIIHERGACGLPVENFRDFIGSVCAPGLKCKRVPYSVHPAGSMCSS